ncbi:hypothetical protein MRBBS_3141 [Marinobacter sp. BSs20148]|nr:hypothetical protein MRBBS_3141 [Marinobacter sp. BSs20148]
MRVEWAAVKRLACAGPWASPLLIKHAAEGMSGNTYINQGWPTPR